MKGEQREKELKKECYFSDDYLSFEQLWSLVDQIHRIGEIRPSSIVEIGVGNGLVSWYLKAMGLRVTTIDINPNLKPDILGSVSSIDQFVRSGEYELISCCEVLEHLPFEQFEPIIRKFSLLSGALYMTLPVYGRHVGFGGLVRFPRVSKWIGAWLKIPIQIGNSTLPPMHFWEIDHKNITSKRSIIRILKKYYPRVQTGSVIANPYHRYFICRSGK